jgi:hypothetical protein
MSAMRPGYDKIVSSVVSTVIDFTAIPIESLPAPILPQPQINESPTVKISSSRCNHTGCKKKLTLIDLKCKCGIKFCLSHRMPEDHACSIDFKADTIKNLEKQLVKISAPKLERI